jgi:hypothetical protein
MNISPLLARLDKVKTTGRGRWIACCPAHDDKHPSLALRELDDGRILIHCFAGCEPLEILKTIGLDWQDLFPDDSRPPPGPPLHRPFFARDIIECLNDDILFVALIAARLYLCETITAEDKDRLLLCAERLANAANLGYRHGRYTR